MLPYGEVAKGSASTLTRSVCIWICNAYRGITAFALMAPLPSLLLNILIPTRTAQQAFSVQRVAGVKHSC